MNSEYNTSRSTGSDIDMGVDNPLPVGVDKAADSDIINSNGMVNGYLLPVGTNKPVDAIEENPSISIKLFLVSLGTSALTLAALILILLSGCSSTRETTPQKKTTERTKDATNKKQLKKSDREKHSGGDGFRKATKTSRRYSNECSKKGGSKNH